MVVLVRRQQHAQGPAWWRRLVAGSRVAEADAGPAPHRGAWRSLRGAKKAITSSTAGRVNRDAWARVAGEMSSAAGLVAGNPGWASPGASTTGSSAVESAKAARQAHADGSDTAAAAFLIGKARQGAQPFRHRASFVRRKQRELARDAERHDTSQRWLLRIASIGGAEQDRRVHSRKVQPPQRHAEQEPQPGHETVAVGDARPCLGEVQLEAADVLDGGSLG